MKKYTEQDIIWNMTRPLDTARVISENGERVKVPDYILDKKKNILKGDQVALLWYNRQPVYNEPIGRGSTLKSILLAIERGMNKYIVNNTQNAKIIYPIIGQFFKENDRLALSTKFEKGKLMPKDLMGDYGLYAGNIGREKKIWIYAVES